MSKLSINGPYTLDADTGVIECDAGKVSDGYHTFEELYEHRCLLFLAFQSLWRRDALARDQAWKSRRHHDGTSYDGWFIAGMALPQGQISYHIPEKYWDLCDAPERETAPEWDGHTSQDVIERLRDWLG